MYIFTISENYLLNLNLKTVKKKVIKMLQIKILTWPYIGIIFFLLCNKNYLLLFNYLIVIIFNYLFIIFSNTNTGARILAPVPPSGRQPSWWYTHNFFVRNNIKSNLYQIVFTIFWLISNLTNFHLDPKINRKMVNTI